jgi:hypothetical protein
MFEVDDVAPVVADVRRRGLVVRDPAASSIRYPSGKTAAWETAWVDEGPGWRPFFIQYPAPRAERLAQRRLMQPQLLDRAFRAVVLETPNPLASANWLAGLLGVRSTVVNGAPEVAAFGCAVRFVCGAADRVTRIVLDGTEGTALIAETGGPENARSLATSYLRAAGQTTSPAAQTRARR